LLLCIWEFQRNLGSEDNSWWVTSCDGFTDNYYRFGPSINLEKKGENGSGVLRNNYGGGPFGKKRISKILTAF
jgi:hypothetical protein